jgi:LacI family transcriptional regulator
VDPAPRRARDLDLDASLSTPTPAVRRVGIRDVARLAGVSQGSVSHYLNHPDRLSAEMRERIQEAIRELGFVRNSMASQLRLGRSTAIAYMAPDVSNPFFASIAEGVEERAGAVGLSVFIVNSHHNRAREDSYLSVFEQNRVQGLLVASYEPIEDRLQPIHARGIPSVIIGQQASSEAQASVCLDEERGGYLAASHLLAIGCRRLAYVGGPMAIHQVHDRYIGARRAVRERPEASLDVIPVATRSVDDGREVAAAIAEQPASQRPDGVFAVNDLTALGVLQGLHSRGIRVPGDIAVIGYDDIEFSAASLITLSSIRMPKAGFGTAAMDLLLAEMAGTPAVQRHVVLQPELVVRDSTG